MKTGCTSSSGKKKKSTKLPILQSTPTPADGIRQSTTSRWRALVLIALNLLMIAHIVQWWIAGRTVSPIEPSETMYTLQRGAVNAGFIFFALAILATLIFGRFVCGWGCHIVALQDLCAWMLKKIGLAPKPFRSRVLVYVPLIAALYMFVWPTAYRAFARPADEPLIPAFTNHIVTENFWETFPTVAVAIPFLLICGFMTVYFLGSKGFCTYACPYGGFFSIADKFAPGKIRVTDACNQCGHCTATCTSNVLVHAEVKKYGMVVDPGCMKCMDCVSVCPNDALYFGFGSPSIAAPGPARIKKSYSLSWPEEVAGAVVFLGSFLAVRGVYALVPFLMALGIAAVTTFVTWKAWRLLRANDVTFYRFNLKSAGKMQTSGWILLSFAVLWIALNVQSGWVRYHEFQGDRAFQRIQIPDELALAQSNPTSWLGPDDLENIAAGKDHFQQAHRFGLFANSEALPKLAWFVFLSGDAQQAVPLMAEASFHQHGQARALSLYYRGAILNRLGRYEEAHATLNEALAERSDLILALEEKGESLWELGRKPEAIAVWGEATQRNPRLVLANNQLAGALAGQGRISEAISFEKRADQSTPANPLYHWVLGLRLQSLGMNQLAEKHFQSAIQLDPEFRSRRR